MNASLTAVRQEPVQSDPQSSEPGEFRSGPDLGTDRTGAGIRTLKAVFKEVVFYDDLNVTLND